MSTQDILDQLNAYTGGDVWGDVILRLDEYDDFGTDPLAGSASDRFRLGDGAVIRWDGQSVWYWEG